MKKNLFKISTALVFALAAGCCSVASAAVDTTPPAATPTQTPAANALGWSNGDVTVSWNWSDGGSGINPAKCTTGSVSSGEGSITLRATCADLAGNVGRASYTVKVDKTAPVPKIISAVDGFGNRVTDSITTQSNGITFKFSATDGTSGIDHYSCRQGRTAVISRLPWTVCTSPAVYTDMANGNHEFDLDAYDKAGNSTSLSFSWEVDARGAIKVIKQTIGDDGTFSFDGTLGSFTIETSDNAGSQVFRNLEAGSLIDVNETPQDGWVQTSNTCQIVKVVAYKTVTCTITNIVTGNLKVVKRTVSGDGTFDFTGDLGSFSITTSGNVGKQEFDNLPADSIYTVNETVPAGWKMVSNACQGVKIVAGETTSCVIKNQKIQ